MLNDDQIRELKRVHKHTRDKRRADRIKAVLYLHYGLSYAEIAKLLLFDEVTIRRYEKQFKEKGIDGLLESRYTGGKARLTTQQEKELREYLQGHTLRTAKEVVSHIKTTYQKEFTVIGATKLLHRLGFTYKKPKVIPGKADKAKQEIFIQQYEATKKQLKTNDRIYFVDATHPEHNTQAEYGWILRGKKNDKYIKTNTGRERLNLNGALDIHGKTAIVLEEKTINADAVLHLLNAIANKQKHGKVYLILDNARYHHARVVRRWRLHHPRFVFLFLPAYSPNLNLIERLWRFFHQKITWNSYYETFTEFKKATLAFFQNIKQYHVALETLLADNFQLFPS
jgi:transposase